MGGRYCFNGIREGRSAMVGAFRFANVNVCHAVDAGFSEKYHVSALSILGHCFDVVSSLPSHASLDSGVNEYLVGQR